MFTSFFLQRLDLIFFFYGLAFLILAAICAVLRRINFEELPWLWLGLFGLTHGLNEWLDMLALSIGDTVTFKWIRLAILAWSFLFLFEFGRRSLIKITGKGLKSYWIYPILISVCAAFWGNLTDLNAMVRYAFGLSGGLCAAWALLYLRSGRVHRYSTAGSMFGYALTTGLIVPKASFFPATLLNQELFLTGAGGIPIQLIRGIFALLIATLIWAYYYRRYQKIDFGGDNLSTLPDFKFGYMIILIALIIVGGDFLTSFFGNLARHEIRNEIEMQVETAATVINTDHVMALSGTSKDLDQPSYHALTQKIEAMQSSIPGLRDLHLLLLLPHSRKIVYAVTTSPEAQGAEIEHPLAELYEVFAHGRALTLDTYYDANGAVISSFVPLLDPHTQKPLAVLAAELNADEWQHLIKIYRLDGIVLIFPVILLIILFFTFQQRILASTKLNEILNRQREQEKYLSLIQASQDAFVVIDLHGRVRGVNEAMCQLSGYRPEQLMAMTIRELDCAMSDEQIAQQTDFIIAGNRCRFDSQWQTRDGKILTIDVSAKYLNDQEGGKIISFIRDITDRQDHETEIKHLNWLYAVQSHIHKCIVEVKSRDELFDQVCQLLIQYGHAYLAQIGLLDKQNLGIELVAQCTKERVILDNGICAIENGLEGCDPIARAILEGHSILFKNCTNNPELLSWHEALDQHQLKTVAAFPIRQQDDVCGALAVYSQDISYFGDKEIALLEEVAQAISFGLDYLDSESQRKQAEIALQQSEMKFRTVYNSNCDAVMMLDANGFFDCNEAALAMFGCPSREVFCSSHPADLSPPVQVCGTNSIVLANQYIATAMEKGNLRFEWTHKRLDTGVTFPAEVVLNALILEGKKVLHASVHEISERKQVEQALRESQARYERAVNGANDGIWEWIPATGEDYLSPRWKQLLGYEDHELPNSETSFFDNIHPEDQSLASEAIRAHLKTHQPYGVELRLRCKNGEYRWFYVRGQAEWDEHGQPLRVSGSISDITEHKNNEVVLLLQARRAEAMLRLPKFAEPWNEERFMQLGQELAEDLTGSQIAFIHFVNEDQETIELVTWSRRTIEHYCHALYNKHYPVGQAGIWADALRQRKPVVINDYASCPYKHGLPEGHSKLTRFITVPVIENDKVVMLAGVGEKNTDYSDLDVESVQLVANEIWRIVQRQRSQIKAARFSRVLEHSFNEIYLFEGQTLKFIDVNLGARLNLGYTLEELQQMSCPEIKSEFTLDTFPALVAPLYSGTVKQIQFEATHTRKDGTTYPVEVRLELTDDNPQLFVAFALDITERKHAENIIRESEALYRAVSQSVNEAIVIADSWGNVVKWNRGAENMFGYTEAEISGQPLSILMPPELRATHLAGLSRLRAGGESHVIGKIVEFTGLRKDQSEFPLAISLAQWNLGERCFYTGVIRDISERKQAELELEQHRQHLEELVAQRTSELMVAKNQAESASSYARSLIEASLDPLVTISPDGKITYANTATERVTGVSREYLIGSDFADYFTHPEQARAGYQQVFSQGFVTDYPLAIKDVHGRVTDVLYNASLYHNDDGDILGVFAAARDVTERKKAEEAAYAASRAKSAFLANMSHEIRTPMNAIIGLTHLLRRSGVTPTQTPWLNEIDNAGQHLLSVINDILDLSKIEAGRFELEQIGFSVDTVLDNVLSLMTRRAQDKGLTISCEQSPVSFWLCGDPTRLRQALLNYAGNAIKFTERGSVILRSRLIEETDEGVLMRFEVEDTGIGIPVENQANLFQSFMQTDVSTTRKYGGTGLGLAITRHLAQMMGGEVGFDSVANQGSTFWFTARLRYGRRNPRPAAIPRSIEESIAALRHYAGSRILLVDDVAINRELTERLLDDSGLIIDMAEDGREAVDKVNATAYALILMDVHMPVMDGLDATRAIHLLPGYEATPIVALTASAFVEDKQTCLEAGMVDVITKPMEPNDLYTMLLKWLPAPDATVPDNGGARQAVDSNVPVSFSGIDIERGLSLWREVVSYQKFLHMFAVDFADSAHSIAQALRYNNNEAAIALAHKLKGVAATLALTSVARYANDIEVNLKRGLVIDEALPKLQQALDTVLVSIACYAPDEAIATNQDISVDSELVTKLAPLFINLLEALDTDNPSYAEPILNELTALLPGKHLQRVITALDSFDFRGAETATRDLAKALNISLDT